MGQLCDESGEIVNDGFVYCSICMAKGLIQRHKKNSATTSILKHLYKCHKIGKKPKETSPNSGEIFTYFNLSNKINFFIQQL